MGVYLWFHFKCVLTWVTRYPFPLFTSTFSISLTSTRRVMQQQHRQHQPRGEHLLILSWPKMAKPQSLFKALNLNNICAARAFEVSSRRFLQKDKKWQFFGTSTTNLSDKFCSTLLLLAILSFEALLLPLYLVSQVRTSVSLLMKIGSKKVWERLFPSSFVLVSSFNILQEIKKFLMTWFEPKSIGTTKTVFLSWKITDDIRGSKQQSGHHTALWYR